MLTVRLSDFARDIRDDVFLPLPQLKSLVEEGRYSYRPFSEVSQNDQLIAVHSFVVVFSGLQALSFRSGKFRPSSDLSYGSRSVGIGGAVFAQDADLLFESMAGVIANGIDELCYGIGLPMQLAERARYENQILPWLGVLVRGGSMHPNVMHVVMGYRCPPEFSPTKAALSINDLQWIDVAKPTNSFDHYDNTSKELLSTGHLVSLVKKSSYQ